MLQSVCSVRCFSFSHSISRLGIRKVNTTLSRASLQKPTPFGPQEEVFQCCLEDNDELFRAELESLELDSPETFTSTIEEIRVAKTAEPTLSVLCEFVAQGWPPDKSSVSVSTALHQYYPWRDKLAVYNGVLYNSHKVVIPWHLQSIVLRKLHRGHQGGGSMVRCTREILQDSVNCSVCASYSFSLLKEPMLSREIP